MSGLTRVTDYLVYCKNSVINSVRRLLNDKLYDIVSVKDFGAIGDGVADDTTAFNNAALALKRGQRLLVPDGDYLVSSIIIDGKVSFTLQIDGNIKSSASKPGASGVPMKDTESGVSPAIKVINCKDFSITGSGSVDGVYRESLYIEHSNSFIVSIHLAGSNLNDNLVGVYIRYCTHFKFHNMNAESTTKKVSPYLTHLNQIQVWDSKYFSFEGVTSINCGMNGIYIGSNCTYFNITGCHLEGNSGSGVQLAWSSFGEFPSYWNISNNTIVYNVADGIDINNTKGAATDTVETFGVVHGNILAYNGWTNSDPLSGVPTADGSGVGTFIKVSRVTVTDNISYGSARSGLALIRCSNIVASGNDITKLELGTVGEGMYIEHCANIVADSNTIIVTDSIDCIKTYGDNSHVRITNNSLHGKLTFADGTYPMCSFKYNRCECPLQVLAVMDMIGNSIAVTTAGNNGLYVTSPVTIERNTITAPNFALVIDNKSRVKVLGNNLTGGNGGAYANTAKYCKFSANTFVGTSAAGIQITGASDNCELSENYATSTSGNSYLIGPSVTLTHKWGNEAGSPTNFGGTYGINF